MNHLKRWGCCVVFTVAGCVQGSAREIVYTNLNCAITYPYGWQHLPNSTFGRTAMVKDSSGAKSIAVDVRTADTSRWPVLDEKFKQDFRWAYQKEGQLIDDRSVTMGGIPAWETTGRLLFEGRPVSIVARMVFADGRVYKINAMYMEGDATTETNLQACLNSFRFLTPPPPPPPADRGSVVVGLLVFVGVMAWITRWAIRKVRRAQAVNVVGQG